MWFYVVFIYGFHGLIKLNFDIPLNELYSSAITPDKTLHTPKTPNNSLSYCSNTKFVLLSDKCKLSQSTSTKTYRLNYRELKTEVATPVHPHCEERNRILS